MKSLAAILINLVLITSCITEFSPKILNSNEYLVFDARLSDKEGALVRLSKIKGNDTRNYPWEVIADVEITDNSGEIIVLNETGPGVYKTGVNGIPGRTYTLTIAKAFSDLSRYPKQKNKAVAKK